MHGLIFLRTGRSAEMNCDSRPPCPREPHEIGPLLLPWRLYSHVWEHLSPLCIYEAMHSCFSRVPTHIQSWCLYNSSLPPSFYFPLQALLPEPFKQIKHLLTFSFTNKPTLWTSLYVLPVQPHGFLWHSQFAVTGWAKSCSHVGQDRGERWNCW